MKLLLIAIITTVLIVVLAVTNNVDNLNKELTGMKVDDTREKLNQADYQGL